MIGKDHIPVGLQKLFEKLIPLNINFEKDGYEEDSREKIKDLNKANAVSSLRTDGYYGETHAIILDLDVPAYLVPSSKPGHSHLYIDVKITKHQLKNLLHTLTNCGVIEEGFRNVSLARGHTSLRLPWINKTTTT